MCELRRKLNTALKKKKQKNNHFTKDISSSSNSQNECMDERSSGELSKFFPRDPSLGSSYLICVCSLGEGVCALHDTVCPQLKLWLPSETLQVGSGGGNEY